MGDPLTPFPIGDTQCSLKLFSASPHLLRRARRLAIFQAGGVTMNAVGRGILIASAVATLIASGSLVARAADKAGDEKVRCAGINECKGQGSCGTEGHSCDGQDAWKGQGRVETDAADSY